MVVLWPRIALLGKKGFEYVSREHCSSCGKANVVSRDNIDKMVREGAKINHRCMRLSKESELCSKA